MITRANGAIDEIAGASRSALRARTPSRARALSPDRSRRALRARRMTSQPSWARPHWPIWACSIATVRAVQFPRRIPVTETSRSRMERADLSVLHSRQRHPRRGCPTICTRHIAIRLVQIVAVIAVVVIAISASRDWMSARASQGTPTRSGRCRGARRGGSCAVSARLPPPSARGCRGA